MIKTVAVAILIFSQEESAVGLTAPSIPPEFPRSPAVRQKFAVHRIEIIYGKSEGTSLTRFVVRLADQSNPNSVPRQCSDGSVAIGEREPVPLISFDLRLLSPQ